MLLELVLAISCVLARALTEELNHKLWSFLVFQDVKLYLCPCVYHHLHVGSLFSVCTI